MYSTKLIIILVSLLVFAEAKIALRELSSVYMPYGYTSSGEGLFALEAGSSEQSVYDPASVMVYTVGE